MATIDGSVNDPTATGGVADRADVWRAARALLTASGMGSEARPDDVLELARFLAGDDF